MPLIKTSIDDFDCGVTRQTVHFFFSNTKAAVGEL